MAGDGFGGLAPTVPTVFESGDIPPITALGLRPDRLLECRGRRGTWSPPSDPGEALELYEKYVNNPASAAAFCAGHAGNVLYKPRVNDWLNRVLTDSLVEAMQQDGLRVLQPMRLKPGDSAVSLGQAWAVAMTRR